MKKIKIAALSAALSISLGASAVAHASTVAATDVMYSVLGGAAVYDQTTNLSWTSNANINGIMNWNTANTWANSLVVNGVSGWSLPTSDSCENYNCTGSQMGNLFYNALGGSATSDIATTHNANYSLFSNIQSIVYWSGTEYAPNTGNAWLFGFGDGDQYAYGKLASMDALAVHPGNVGAVPEPEEWALMAAGLGLMSFVARRKRT